MKFGPGTRYSLSGLSYLNGRQNRGGFEVQMIRGWLGLTWFVWAALAGFVMIVFSFVWPREAITSPKGVRYLAVRWGHSVTWMLLAINFLLRGISLAISGVADLVALAAGLMYALFLVMTFGSRS